MASSKFTDTIVPVPDAVIDFSVKHPGYIFPNLRPVQRNPASDGPMDPEFDEFLKGILSPTMVAIHYQLYRPEVWTVVAELYPVKCWESEEGLPRLDFEKPSNWNQCPNLWGRFVLTIARVGGIQPSVAVADPQSRQFIEIVEKYGRATSRPRFRRDLLIPIDLGEFQAFDRGETISQLIPRSFRLQAGDRFEYEAGSNISGIATVVSVGKEHGSSVHCQLKKVN